MFIDDDGSCANFNEDLGVFFWEINKASDPERILKKFQPGSVWHNPDKNSALMIKEVKIDFADDGKLPTQGVLTISAVDFPIPDGCYTKFNLDSSELIKNYKKYPSCSQCGSINLSKQRPVVMVNDYGCDRIKDDFSDISQTCNDCGHGEIIMKKDNYSDIIERYSDLEIDQIEILAKKLQPIIEKKYIEACQHTELKNGRCMFCQKEFIVTLTEIKPEDKYYD